MMKKRVQAQRKFAQGAYIPGSGERRADVTPTSHREAAAADDRRLPKVIINKGSARSLLDLVSMRNLHHHGQPIVLVERMLGAPLNVVDKPKSTEALVETPQLAANGLKEQKGKESTTKSPKSPKKLKIPLKSCRVLLRSRSSNRRIIKARNCVTNKINVNKRSHPPTRGETSKKKCTRNKSPGFSDDDDMPLNKITQNNVDTKLTKAVEDDNMRLSKMRKGVEGENIRLGKTRKSVDGDNIPLSKMPKAEEGDNISSRKIQKSVEAENIPLSKIPKEVVGSNTRLSKLLKAAEGDNIPLSKIPKAVEGDNTGLSKATVAGEGDSTRLSKMSKSFERDNFRLSITRLSKVAKALEGDNVPLSKIPAAVEGENIRVSNTRLSKMTKALEGDSNPLSKMPETVEGENIRLSNKRSIKMAKGMEGDNIPLTKMPEAVVGENIRLSNTRLSKMTKAVEGDNIPLSKMPEAAEGENIRLSKKNLSKIAKAAESDNNPLSKMPDAVEGENIRLSNTRLSKMVVAVEGDDIPLSKMPEAVEGENFGLSNTRFSKMAKAVEGDNIPLSKLPKAMEGENIPLSKTAKAVDGDNVPLSQISEAAEGDNIRLSNTRMSRMAKTVESDNIPLSKMPKTVEGSNIRQNHKRLSKMAKSLDSDNLPLSKMPKAVEGTNIRQNNLRLSKVAKAVEGDNTPLSKISKAVDGSSIRPSKMSKSLEKNDVPLKKKAHMNKSNTNEIKELVKGDIMSKMTSINYPNGPLKDSVKDGGSDSKVNVDKKPFCTLRSAAIRFTAENLQSMTEPTKDPKLKKEIKIDLQSSSLNLYEELKGDSIEPDSAVGNSPKPICNESYYGRNRIERWIVDSTATPPTPPAPVTPEAHHFKVPQPLTKRTKLKSPDPTPALVPAPAPCPSEKFYAAKNVHTATESDIDSFCKKCITCRKLSMLVNLKGEKRATASKAGAVRPGPEPGDVYAFVDSEPPALAPRPGGYTPKRLKTKHTKNMYLDLPQNSEHIVKLVEVKMPNQVKPIMSARLVPKTELDQDEADDKEPAVLKKYGETLSALATSANASNIGSSKGKPDGADDNLYKGSDVKLCSKYAKAKESSQGPAGSSKPDVEITGTVEAPTFRPTEAEFENPIAYLEKIAAEASSFGLCKVVPPESWTASCRLEAGVRFTATNQYVGRMFRRWGAAARELCAIKTHLATQQVLFTRPPLIDGIEVNLPKLYHIVQRMGGLKKVIEKEKWTQVAQELRLGNGEGGAGGRGLLGKKLDQVYVKYLLPYDTLTNRERQQILAAVDREWKRRYERMLQRARSPLRKQLQQLVEAEADESAPAREDDSDSDSPLPDETDDCVLRGRPMSMLTFEKVAERVMAMHFPGAGAEGPGAAAAEAAYWRLVESGDEHVCVNTAAVDTGARGLGFPRSKAEVGARNPWNLKVLSNSAGSVLRSLGAVLSLTVPTLHLGMLFSTSCWHRDPHGLPWLEYHHAGPSKIWYGVAAARSECLRRAVEQLCPAYCQNKAIWLPSDVVMIPPRLLTECGVPLARLQQAPGEFVVVFPKAYSCSICTGHTISESVYYAPPSWLDTVQADFQMVRESFEPTVFSLEQLLLALVNDARAPPSALHVARHTLVSLVGAELHQRRALRLCGVTVTEVKHPAKKKATSWNVRELSECDICRTTLYLSKVSGLGDRRGAHCLQHALLLLRPLRQGDRRDRDCDRDCDPPEEQGKGDVVLHCFYSEAALHHALGTLRRRLALSAEDR